MATSSIGCSASIDFMFIQDCIAITLLFELVSGWPTLQTNMGYINNIVKPDLFEKIVIVIYDCLPVNRIILARVFSQLFSQTRSH